MCSFPMEKKRGVSLWKTIRTDAREGAMNQRCFAAIGVVVMSSSLAFAQGLPDGSGSTIANGPGATSIMVLPGSPLPGGQVSAASSQGGAPTRLPAADAGSTKPGVAGVEAAQSCDDSGVVDGAAGDMCQGGGAWLSVDYLLWWVRSGPTGGALLTIGSPTDRIPGALGARGTRVLFGDQPLNYNPLSGLRLYGGLDLTPDIAVEGGYFRLERGAAQYLAASNSTGNPIIARPVFNNQTGLQDVYATSLPGEFSGATNISAHTVLQGYELNLAAHLIDDAGSHLDLLVGFRALDLNEDLGFQDTLRALAPGGFTFLGAPVNPPSTVSDFDRFHAVNHFYGGQLGARWQASSGSLSADVTGKVALGSTQQLVIVDGATTLNAPGQPPVTAPGGVLAQRTNMGRHYRSEFSAIPELDLNLGWRLTDQLTFKAGYSLLYWGNVVRPGNQIDRNINPALPPTDQVFGNGLGQNRPAFGFRSSTFWAQGVNFGLTYRF
jgi:hypothetical protein